MKKTSVSILLLSALILVSASIYSYEKFSLNSKSDSTTNSNKNLNKNIRKVTSEEDDNFRACLVDICGLPENHLDPEELNELKRNRIVTIKDKFEPMLDENFKSNLERLKYIIEMKSKFIKQTKQLSVNNGIKKIVLGIKYLNLLSDFIEIYSESGTKEDINNSIYYPKKFWKGLEDNQINSAITKMQLNKDEQVWFKNLIKKGLLLDQNVSIMSVFEMELPTLLRTLNPDVDLEKSLQINLKSINLFSAHFLKSIGFKTVENIVFTVSGQVYKNPEIIYDEKELAFEIQMFSVIRNFFNPKYIDVLNLNYDWDNFISVAFKTESIFVDALEDTKFISDMKSLINSECLSSIEKTLDTSNSELQRRQFTKYISEVKDEVKRTIRFSSVQTQSLFDSKINGLQLFAPKNLNTIEYLLEKGILDLTIDTNRLKQFLNEEPNLVLQLVLLQSLSANDDVNVQDLNVQEKKDYLMNTFRSSINDPVDVCGSHLEFALSDRIISKISQTNVSWASVRFPKYGIGIVAHELGHFVASTLKDIGASQNGPYYFGLNENLPIWEDRFCINTPSKLLIYMDSKVPKGLPAAEERLFTEEDWADYFGAKITSEFSKKQTWIKNFGCALVPEDNAGEYVSTLLPNSQAVHSTALKRVLLIQKASNAQMPKSCEKIIKDQSLFSCLR